MFCSQCGTNLEANAKFCSKCGHPTVENNAPKFQETVTGTTSIAVSPTTEYPKQIGTKWLKFWNYASLPIGGIINLFFGYLMLLNFPIIGIIIISMAIIQFAVAYGLHYRKLWAWQWNWVIIGIAYLGMLIPILPNGSDNGVVVQFIIRLVVSSLIWMWPNYVYWKKRKILFSGYANQFANLEIKNSQVNLKKVDLSLQSKTAVSVYGDNKWLTVIISVVGLIGVGLLISQMVIPYKNPLQPQPVAQVEAPQPIQNQTLQPSLNPFEQILQKANAGETDAQNKLCVMYLDGEGTQKNENLALQWCWLAANQGHAAAQYNLSIMYINGYGLKRDDKEAFYWMKSSAEQGISISQYHLALMYTNGQGIQKNSLEAAKWYHLAANQGHAAAQNDLGFMYASGEGVPQNYVEALKWFRKSAEQGNAPSQYSMGFLYEEGLGVPMDLNNAVYWYQEAAKNGYEEAKKALENFSEIGTTTGGAKIIRKETKVQNPASSTTKKSNNMNDPKTSEESDGTHQIQYSYSNGRTGSISGDLPKVRQQMREELMKRGLHIP